MVDDGLVVLEIVISVCEARGSRRPERAPVQRFSRGALSRLAAVFEQAYGSVLVIVAGSIVLGRAICSLCGGAAARWSAAPFVGFAALMALADAAIKLPGRAGTALVVCLLAVVLAAAYLARRASRARSSPRGPFVHSFAGDALIGALGLCAASIPFIAQGRVGPGAFVDGDMAIHLVVVEALSSAKVAAYYHVLGGYPTGPHALVAAVSTGTGAQAIQVFTGLLISIMVLTAIVAGDVLGGESLWRRAVIGLLSGAAYLVAAYYGESAFKETIMAGLVLAFALHLGQVAARWADASQRVRFTMALPAGVLLAGSVYTYSYLGVAWFVTTFAAWVVVGLAVRPRLARELLTGRNLTTIAPWALGFVLLLLIVLLPIFSDISSFFGSFGLSPQNTITGQDLGNLRGPLSIYEALGIWGSGDFRVVPANHFDAGELGAFALAILVFGVFWSLRRRQLPLLAAGLGCAVVWLYSNATQSPYVTAKAMVIGAPVVIAIGMRALLTSRQGGRLVTVTLLAFAAIFGVAAGYSSYTTLRNEPVQSSETVAELAAFHRLTGNAPTLFLGIDSWAVWELHDSPVWNFSPGTEWLPTPQSPPNKPFNGQPLDFDSVVSPDLNEFAYVVTSDTDFASEPPSNFHLVSRRPLYELWKRIGPTPPRATIEGAGQPGAILDCSVPLLRSLSERAGVAAVMTQPVIVGGIPGLAPGHSGIVRIGLPARTRWEISAQYTAWTPITFSAEGRRFWMPAYMGQNGPFFNVGAVTGRGVSRQIAIRISAGRPSILTGTQPYDSVYNIAATRLPDVRRMMPLRDACGRYVDWFRLS